ncbi:thioesterase [Actinosynnema sp. ALI-1.44]|uniref:thioesterase II family protein n=1 Tax=Actinosynnema sp. ALI-1.44 TaxID=1933779 RepID=UPI00097BE85C|nr:alpha/beta fold hydrolase [Actinosynnema sp. ALI-1.44]ONI75272.1 thioesterase [Actinosynnema sp. ALI-1.44]
MPDPTDDDLWLRCYRPVESPVARLVCFPHAGGTAPFYRPVPFALNTADRVEVLAVQYPGRQDRRHEEPIADMHALADGVFAVLARRPRLPLVLFGHSMGAVVAFEVARRCERAGLPVARLIVSGRRGPAVEQAPARNVHAMTDAAIMDEIRRLDGSASIVLSDPDMMAAALPSLRADYRAIETYRVGAEAAVGCPVTSLSGDQDPMTSVAEAGEWRTHTTGEFDLRVFPGGHFFLVEQMPRVIDILDRHLSDVVSDHVAEVVG